jgi:hypothetical protein
MVKTNAGGPFLTIYLYGRRYTGPFTEWSAVVEAINPNLGDPISLFE